MGLSLAKVAAEAPELLQSATLANTALAARNLSDLTAEVALVLDFSGSMSRLYQDGSVQALLNKVLALATQLDDDGQVDLFIFGTEAEYLGKVDLANFRTVVKDFTKNKRMGSTNYADAFRKVVEHFGTSATVTETTKKGFFGKKTTTLTLAPLSAPVAIPALAIFVTDGAPDSQPEAVEELTKASYRPIFWQFLSIGGPIPFLQKLDDLDGRYIDNADYKNVKVIKDLDDSRLIDMALDEYPGWVAEERTRGQIK